MEHNYTHNEDLIDSTVMHLLVDMANYTTPHQHLHPVQMTPPRRYCSGNCFITYYTPLLVAVGFLSNSICVVLLLNSILRKWSSSYYLFSISLLNTAYLMMLFMKWLTFLGYNVYDRPAACHAVDMLSNLSSFLSVWLAVTFCVDRYIAICWPQESPKMCTTTRAKIVLICLVIVGVTIYLNISLTVAVSDKDGKCKPVKPFHFSYITPLRVMDLIVNHVLPYLVVLTLLGLIARSIYQQRNGSVTLWQTDNTQIRTTTFLYLSVFLLAHIPADCIRIVSFISKNSRKSSTLFTLQLITDYISHTAMALNLLILLLTHQLFRQTLLGVFRVKRMCLPCTNTDNNQLPECIELKLSSKDSSHQTPLTSVHST